MATYYVLQNSTIPAETITVKVEDWEALAPEYAAGGWVVISQSSGPPPPAFPSVVSVDGHNGAVDLSGTYLSLDDAAEKYLTQVGVVHDTDGVYYLASPAGMHVDIDGTAYYSSSNATARVAIDTDSVPYPIAL